MNRTRLVVVIALALSLTAIPAFAEDGPYALINANLFDGVYSDVDLRRRVNINIDRGVDVIKTRGTQRAGLPDTDPRQQVYTQRQLRVIVDEAAKHDVPVLVHAHGDEGARAAVLAGARSIEHGTYMSTETLELMK